MLSTRINRRLLSLTAAGMMLFAVTAPLTAAPGSQANAHVALRGQAAASFSLPGDMQRVAQRALPAYRITADRYRQHLGESEVLGGELTIYRDKTGQPLVVVGAHHPGLAPQNEISLTPGQARRIVMQELGHAGEWKTTLMFNPRTSRYYYNVENRGAASRWFHWIDAEDGSVVNAYDGLAHGTGIGVLGDTKDLTGLTSWEGGAYKMISADGRQTTHDARNRNRLPGVVGADGDDFWDNAGRKSPGHAALVDAHSYAKVTDDYYLATHNFNWLDHYSQGMVSSAHVQRNYNNAYWNGSQMAYGDGDGSSFIELSGDLDVVGHELSHGVTEATSNLIYQNESGALNEAFSDIMGTAIEYYHGSGNWTIGEDITPGDNGIRNMADPGEDGDPSHYAERYTGTGDNGGVHINSGIANHWFYLLVNGGQNSDPQYASGTDVTGVGMAKAEAVAYLGFTALPANADFCAARSSTMTVAGIPNVDQSIVADAWDEVGVNDSLCNESGGGGGEEGGSGPLISNVASAKLRGTKFEITWDTDVAADSTVTFTCCGSFSDSGLTTAHRMTFNGQKRTTYEYFVSSTDASGRSTTQGSFTHKN